MAKTCAKCGKSLGGIFGVIEANQADFDPLRDEGLDIPNPLCYACSIIYSEKLNNLNNKKQISIQENIKLMTICTVNPYSHTEYEIVGVVSSHVALGTGPLNQILSSISDFFGEQSENYNSKMIEAESACMAKLERNAAEMGANAVIGLRTTYTELTQGHGMLLVCMNGTAIKKKL